MQHTDCGIVHLQGPENRELLAAFLGATVDELDSKAVADPYGAVRVDIQALADNPFIPASLGARSWLSDARRCVEIRLLAAIED